MAWLIVLLLASAAVSGCSVFRNSEPDWVRSVRCEPDVDRAECLRRAEKLVEMFGRGRVLQRIVVRTDGHEVCWLERDETVCVDAIH